MDNSLGKKFTFISLLRFALPTIIMTLCSSLYVLVDGFFVSKYIGSVALSGINIFMPVICSFVAIGVMFSTGSNAIVAKKLGEKKNKEAKENFTFITIIVAITGIIIGSILLFFLEPILVFLGANENIFPFAHDYAKIYILFYVPFLFQFLFQMYFITVGKPAFGLIIATFSGLLNVFLDYFFIVKLGMGISGAALATGIGASVVSIFGILYFSLNRKGILHFVLPRCDWKMLLYSCTNGSSEMVANLSMAVTSYLFNVLLMKYLGEIGVASLTIILYVEYFLVSIFMGYSLGISPIISFKYGHKDFPQLSRILKISLVFLIVFSLSTFFMSLHFAEELVQIFAPKGSQVYKITLNGFYLFGFTFLLVGFNIFASAFFTALSNGKISAVLSFLRTFVFILAGLLILPKFFGINGIWLAVPLAEAFALIIAIYCFYHQRDKYNYFKY